MRGFDHVDEAYEAILRRAGDQWTLAVNARSGNSRPGWLTESDVLDELPMIVRPVTDDHAVEAAESQLRRAGHEPTRTQDPDAIAHWTLTDITP